MSNTESLLELRDKIQNAGNFRSEEFINTISKVHQLLQHRRDVVFYLKDNPSLPLIFENTVKAVDRYNEDIRKLLGI